MSSFTLILSNLILWAVIFSIKQSPSVVYIKIAKKSLYVQHQLSNAWRYVYVTTLSIKLCLTQFNNHVNVISWQPSYNRLPYIK